MGPGAGLGIVAKGNNFLLWIQHLAYSHYTDWSTLAPQNADK